MTNEDEDEEEAFFSLFRRGGVSPRGFPGVAFSSLLPLSPADCDERTLVEEVEEETKPLVFLGWRGRQLEDAGAEVLVLKLDSLATRRWFCAKSAVEGRFLANELDLVAEFVASPLARRLVLDCVVLHLLSSLIGLTSLLERLLTTEVLLFSAAALVWGRV